MFFGLCDNFCYISFLIFGGGGGILSCFVGIAFCVYTLLSLVSPCIFWLSSWISFCLPMTVIILILLILAALWLWMRDDWILCWRLLYCCLLGKDGIMNFPDSKWHLGNSGLFKVQGFKFKVMFSKQFTEILSNFSWGWFTDILKNC